MCLTVLVTGMAGSTVVADDSDKPIGIQADSAEINENTGISIYRGNVRVTQGTTVLTGDTVVIESDDAKVRKIKTEGNLSTFRQATNDGKTVYAQAVTMVYDITKKQIMLTENAKLTENGNTLESDSITFDTDKKTVSGGGATGHGRVSITVLPETVTDESANPSGP